MVGKKFGQYHLLEKIDQGGMAEIYRARRLGPHGFQKLLAIKRILPHLSMDKEFVAMFSAEAKVTAQLQHPNIVQIYDYGCEGQTYYIAMEYIHGLNLSELISVLNDTHQSIPVNFATYIMKKVCSALEYAHFLTDFRGRPLRIVHRDVNPKNIMVSFPGEVKLMDFGIALAASRAYQTMADGIIKGKLAYLSPEQVKSQDLDHRSDVFSLGIVFYELITGKRPFNSETEFGILSKVEKATYIAPEQLSKNVPVEISAMIDKCLKRNRQERYESAGKLLVDIERFETLNRLRAQQSEFRDFLEEVLGTEVVNSPMLSEDVPTSESLDYLDLPESVDLTSDLPGLGAPPLPSSVTTAPDLPRPAGGTDVSETRSSGQSDSQPGTGQSTSSGSPADTGTGVSTDGLESIKFEPSTITLDDAEDNGNGTDNYWKPPSRWDRYRTVFVFLLVIVAIGAVATFFFGREGMQRLLGLSNHVYHSNLTISVKPEDASIEVDSFEVTGNPVTQSVEWPLQSQHVVSVFHHEYRPVKFVITVPESTDLPLSASPTEPVTHLFEKSSSGFLLDVQMTAEYVQLTVHSNPEGARVFIDDIDTEKTTPMEFSFPTSQVSKIRAEKTGYTHAFLEFQPDPHDPSKSVLLTLEKTAQPTAAPKPQGYLRLNSPYPVDVFLDGQRLGRNVTKKTFKINSGSRSIRLVNEDVRCNRTENVEIQQGATSSITLEATGFLMVDAEPPDCLIIIDDHILGKAPGRFELAPGMYNVIFKWTTCNDTESRWAKINSHQNRSIPKVIGCR